MQAQTNHLLSQMNSMLQRKRKSAVRKLNGRKKRKLARRNTASLVMTSTNDVAVELVPVRAHLGPANTRITGGFLSPAAVARLRHLLVDMRRAMMKWNVKENAIEIGGDGT